MENITIISHLTPAEWKASWRDKVVEDDKEHMRATQALNCFWGHFKSDSEFTICFHKEYEIKGMSMGMYFNGRLDADPQGSRITGKFGKKRTANLFLILGIILCLAAMLGSVLQHDHEILIVASVLLVILLIFYISKPGRGQNRILKHLEKISFDDQFHRRKHSKKKK